MKIRNYIFSLFLLLAAFWLRLWIHVSSKCPQIMWPWFTHPSTASISSVVSYYWVSSPGLGWIELGVRLSRACYETTWGVLKPAAEVEPGNNSLRRWAWQSKHNPLKCTYPSQELKFNTVFSLQQLSVAIIPAHDMDGENWAKRGVWHTHLSKNLYKRPIIQGKTWARRLGSSPN